MTFSTFLLSLVGILLLWTGSDRGVHKGIVWR